MTFTFATRNHISMLLAFSMLFSIFFLAATPPAEAGLFRCMAKVGRVLSITAAAAVGGLVGTLVGMATGMGVGSLVGMVVGAALAGKAMAAITARTVPSAISGAVIGGFYGLAGGPLGSIAGAITGSLVGAAIGFGANDSNFACGHYKKGAVVASGYIKGASQPPKARIAEISEPIEVPEEILPVAPIEEVPTESTTAAAEDANNDDDDMYVETPEEATDDMSVEASIQLLVMQANELDSERNIVLANKTDSENYENILEQRELVAKNLTRKLIKESEENNGNPGEALNRFKTNIQKLEPQKRAALNDVIEAIKDNAVHNQVNNPCSDGFKVLTAELERL